MRHRRGIANASAENGFTLIELLVVIIIIGILAAIAVPVFLNQKSRATDSTIKGDIRTLAQFQESYHASYFTYGAVADLLTDGSDVRASPAVTLTVVSYDGTAYCLSGASPQTDQVWYFDSLAGGFQPRGSAGCPSAIGGAPGGTVVGP